MALGANDQMIAKNDERSQDDAMFKAMHQPRVELVGSNPDWQSSLAGPGQAPVSSTDPQKLAESMASTMFGWTGSEWNALYDLVNRESGWNPDADNPSSSAAGLFQKMTNLHGPLEPTLEGQISWGLNYIHDRYGTPSAALDHWLKAVPINGQDVGHWY